MASSESTGFAPRMNARKTRNPENAGGLTTSAGIHRVSRGAEPLTVSVTESAIAMCGILGIAGNIGAEDVVLLRERLQKLRHRGPDACGLWHSAHVAMAHSRLAIIDLSERASQPMSSADGDVVISFNGEIYNFVELRSELQRQGHDFRSSSDTEVVLNGYLAWGEGVFEKLNGMFALALFDARNQTLLLVRDQYGIKPLYYTRQRSGSLAFASEIKALRTEGDRLNDERVGEYMYYGTVHGSDTLYRGIHQLRPGTLLRYDVVKDGVDTRSYWSQPLPGARQATGPVSMPAEKMLVELFHEAVGRQLVSDRPVGIFLSGGVDSSAIACSAVQHHGKDIALITARFTDGANTSDVTLSQRLARDLGCKHYVIDIDREVNLALVDRMIDTFDGPFADAAAIPLMILADSLPNEIKVVLQGDGGDEIFVGYPRYRYLHRLARIPVLALRSAAAVVSPFLKAFPFRWQRILHAVFERDQALQLARLLTMEFPESERSPEQLVVRTLEHWDDPFTHHVAALRETPRAGAIEAALAVDFQTILPSVFLEKVDRATMAASVEVRVPFLDKLLVEFAMSLPAGIRMPGGRQKGLLRNALGTFVPDYILSAPKRGFGVPYGEWVRGPLYPDVHRELSACPFYATTKVLDLLKDHCERRSDHSFMVWKLFLFARWMGTQPAAFAR